MAAILRYDCVGEVVKKACYGLFGVVCFPKPVENKGTVALYLLFGKLFIFGSLGTN